MISRLGFVNNVVVHERRRMDEFDDGCVENGAVAVVAAEPRRHQQHGGPNALTAGGLNVLADLRDQIDLGLNMPAELQIDAFQVGTDRLEELREGKRRLFHSGSG